VTGPGPRYRLRPSARFRTVFEEGLALDQETARLHVLNPAAATILDALASAPRTVPELVECVVEVFDVAADTARRDVEVFLEEAVAQGLVEAVTGP